MAAWTVEETMASAEARTDALRNFMIDDRFGLGTLQTMGWKLVRDEMR